MIISHKLKCIYIKNHKIAGTSFEIALSKYCSPDDIIAPLPEKQERYRVSLGGVGHRNLKTINKRIWHYWIMYRRVIPAYFGTRIRPYFPRITDLEHLEAYQVKHSIPSNIWNDYLKIATIRCPYDTVISLYYFRKSQQENHNYNNIQRHICRLTNSRNIYHGGSHIDGTLVPDFLIRYECLDEDIKKLETKINCAGLLETFQNVKAKTKIRPERETSACEVFSKYPDSKARMDKVLYKNQNKYEFLRKYWPMYKAKLEEEMANFKG